MRSACALAVVALAFGACYSPDLDDCAVRCASGDDCGGDQVCGRDGFCAAPDVAGQCQAPVPAMPQNVLLRVVVDGRGRLALGASRVCGKLDADHDECSWQVPKAAAHQLIATPGPAATFDRWTTKNCEDAAATTCTLTLAGPASVGVKFRAHADDEDAGPDGPDEDARR